jgi:hypothetical protein
MDVRPAKRNSIKLLDIDFEVHPLLKTEIKTSQVVILYYSKEKNIKTTIYTSGRMLIDSRDEKLVKEIIQTVSGLFPK